MIDTSLQQSEPVALPQRPMGRQVRSVAAYALLTALMIITPILVFVPAAVFHCAIRNGRRATFAMTAIALIIAAAYINAAHTAQSLMMAWSALAGVALAVVVPALAVLPLVERAERFGRVLVFLLMGSAAGLAITELGSRALFSFSPFAVQVAEAQRSNAQFIQFYKANGMSPEVIGMMQRWAAYNTFVLPGFLLIMISLVFILSLLMLGRLKAWRELAAARGDVDKEALGAYLFRNFALPDWLLFAFIIGGLTPLATGVLQKVAANTLTVVAFLYILQGLAIFRFFLLAMGAGFAGTMLGWLLLLFLTLTGVGPLLLGLAGLFDPFFDFRHFKKRKDDSHESHSD